MKLILIALLLAAMTACGSSGSGTSNTTEVKLDTVGLSWRVPSDWTPDDSAKGSTQVISYNAPKSNAGIFRVRATPALPGDRNTPVDENIRKLYEATLSRQTAGKNKDVKMATIGGVPGVTCAGVLTDDSGQELIFTTFREYQGQQYYIIVNAVGKNAELPNNGAELNAIIQSMTATK